MFKKTHRYQLFHSVECQKAWYKPIHDAKVKVSNKAMFRSLKNDNVKLTRRTCLGLICNGEKTFMSEGPWNRVCKKCKEKEPAYDSMVYAS